MTGHLTGIRLRESLTEAYLEDRSANAFDLDLVDAVDDSDDLDIVWSKSNEEGLPHDEDRTDTE